MGNAPHFLQLFGSDPLKRLHGCAVAEADRGADSPCRGLARPLRRPQLGLGNPQAPIVFLSPSPLDPVSASNEAFGPWLESEAALQHHLISETVRPYFRFVRAVLHEVRHRFGQTQGKQDVFDLAFHTWAVRCATENPDRVTEGAVNQCADRHLASLLKAVSPQVIVAMGGPTARYFWWRNRQSWKDWRPMTALHGQTLPFDVGGRPVPVVLSVHPYQRDVEPRPDVIGRAVAEALRPADLEPRELTAA